MDPEQQGRFRWLELPEEKPSGTALSETPGEEREEPRLSLRQGNEELYRGKFEKALVSFSRALRGDKGLAAAWVGQVVCLLELGEVKEAQVWVDKALDYFPKSSDLNAAQAFVLCRRGERERALGYSDASLSLPGGSEFVWLVRGEILLAGKPKKKELALSCFEKVLEGAPRNWMSIFQVGMAWLRQSCAAEAHPYLEQALELNSSNPYIWLTLGECQKDLGLKTRARFSLEKTLELTPFWDAPLRMLKSLRRPFWQFWKR
jgi:tetratricopeptide (TPR) repeat protein